MEIGYIFFNQTLQKYCVQEFSKEPDDIIYLHTIKPYESVNVIVNGSMKTYTGINKRCLPPEQWSFLEGLEVQII